MRHKGAAAEALGGLLEGGGEGAEPLTLDVLALLVEIY